MKYIMERETPEALEKVSEDHMQRVKKTVRARQPGEALAEIFRELPGFYYSQSGGPNPRFLPAVAIRIERAFGFCNQCDLSLSDHIDPIVQHASARKNGIQYLTNLACAATVVADEYPDQEEFAIDTDEGAEIYEDRLCDFYTRLEWRLSEYYERHPAQGFVEKIKTLSRPANEALLGALVKGRFKQRYTKNPSELAFAVDDWIEVFMEKSDNAQA